MSGDQTWDPDRFRVVAEVSADEAATSGEPDAAPEPEYEVFLDGLVMGESARWHDGALWLCDWGTGEVLRLADDGSPTVVARVEGMPVSMDWLQPSGAFLVLEGSTGRVLVDPGDGSLAPYADLAPLSTKPWNELVTHPSGRAYANGIGFDLMTGEAPEPGLIAVIEADGTVRKVADDLQFPNGMAVTPDGSTLLVAESYASRITAFTIGPDGDLHDRRVWADLPGWYPDGISLAADGSLYVADVPGRACLTVVEGGDLYGVLGLDRGCFTCAVGTEPNRLFLVTAEWGGSAGAGSRRTGQVLVFDQDRRPSPRPGEPLEGEPGYAAAVAAEVQWIFEHEPQWRIDAPCELVRVYAEESEAAVRVVYRWAGWNVILGYRWGLPRVDGPTLVAQAASDIVDDVSQPLGRYADLLVEEGDVSWWGDGYRDISEHPDFTSGTWPFDSLKRPPHSDSS